MSRQSLADATQVTDTLAPEGPQVVSMSSDVAEALNEDPDASRFFESLATFYQKEFIRRIEGAKRPEARARLITETVAALKERKREL